MGKDSILEEIWRIREQLLAEAGGDLAALAAWATHEAARVHVRAVPRLYLETSVISYLTARPSRNTRIAADQQITQRWWSRRDAFDIHVSTVVLAEIERGDTAAATRRTALIAAYPVLEETKAAEELAAAISRDARLGPRAWLDALHMAVATVNGMDYLLTWNCKHLAKEAVRRNAEITCWRAGYVLPVICTPAELSEE